jgi:hypothetical protein
LIWVIPDYGFLLGEASEMVFRVFSPVTSVAAAAKEPWEFLIAER